MRSWIVLSIVAYIIASSLCCFALNTPYWYDYFWWVTLVFNILSLSYNLKIDKTYIEMVIIYFVLTYRVFCLLYLAVSKITHNDHWMNESIFFLSSLGISGIFGIIIWRYRYHGKI